MSATLNGLNGHCPAILKGLDVSSPGWQPGVGTQQTTFNPEGVELIRPLPGAVSFCTIDPGLPPGAIHMGSLREPKRA